MVQVRMKAQEKMEEQKNEKRWRRMVNSGTYVALSDIWKNDFLTTFSSQRKNNNKFFKGCF
jgi:hypothetical protein